MTVVVVVARWLHSTRPRRRALLPSLGGAFVGAAKIVTLVALGLTAVTFALGFLLPHKAKAAAH